ncbi:Fur family transcriptional regulator [uncultured Maritimibacter sp.]|uniref:Fur family transcriptional regulator n=1 Tax=uncultured Maritimibacter sp. TaxID=991866 RepID=UPI000A8303A9|nr:transcriptional repressor [uncultured Maritimibacter sp.]
MPFVGFGEHNHTVCVHDALADAARHCAEHGLRLTEIRKRVFEMLLEEHRAMGAYEILDRLKEEGRGSQPPVAYRALDFLVTNGFVHKIERLNAYVACADPCSTHFPAFMICRVCDSVAETTAAPSKGLLGQAAKAAGFKIEQTVVEALGVCPACIDGEARG